LTPNNLVIYPLPLIMKYIIKPTFKKIFIMTYVIFIFSFQFVTSQQLAFPSALGAGAYTSGGRGLEVYHVTNLNDSGPGSLRDALSANNRTILFDVSGVINLTSSLNIVNKFNITIAGQTAPEGGITIDGDRVFFQNVQNLIVRHIRFKGGIDSQSFNGGGTNSSQAKEIIKNQMWDHCTFSFGEFQGGSWYETDSESVIDSLTVQRCFFAENDRGSIAGGGSGNGNTTGSFSFISNAFYNVKHRTPNVTGDDGARIDIINNVVWWIANRFHQMNGSFRLNQINNYYNYNNTPANDFKMQMYGSNVPELPQIYTNGNKYVVNSTNPPLNSSFAEIDVDNSLAFKWFVSGTFSGTYGEQVPSTYFTNVQHALNGKSFTPLTAEEAFIDVSNNVGCNARLNADGSVSDNTDTLDFGWLENIRNGIFTTSRLPMNQWNVPAITSLNRDSDFYVSNPHIPEVWFSANVPDGQDHNDIAPSGYTWLEEYLNGVDRIVPVNHDIETLEVTPDVAELRVTETVELDVIVNGDPELIQTGVWTSSDPSIATVDENGIVTAIETSATSPYEAMVTITFTTIDINGEEFSDSSQITVFPEALVASAGSDQQICEGESTMLTASGGTNYVWSTGETTASITIFPDETTTYSVTVSDEYNQSVDDEITVFVNPIPVAEASEDQTICEGETVTLIALGGDSYLWSTGETTSTIDVSPTEDTVYEVEVISNNCSSTDSVTVFVTEAPDISVTEDFVLVEGQSATLVVEGSDNYQWSTGETTVSINIAPMETTTYSVSSIGSNGCSTTLNVTVTVIPEVVADAGLDSSICRDDVVTLTATGGGTYLWSTGDTTADLIVIPQITTTYTVTVTDDYGYSDTDSVTITVNETPYITVSDDVAILEGETVTLTATGGDNYLWSTGETTASIVVTPSETTTYTVVSTAIGGCADIEREVLLIFGIQVIQHQI